MYKQICYPLHHTLYIFSDPSGGRLAQREPQVLPLLRRQQSLLGVFRAPAAGGIGLAPVVAGEAPPLFGHLRAHQDGLAPKRSKLFCGSTT